MKLGMIAPKQESSFRTAAEWKLDFLEFTFNVNRQNPSDYAETDEFVASTETIKGWSEQYGVGIGSIGRWGHDRLDANGGIIEAELHKCFELIDATSALGCGHFVTGCNRVEGMSFLDNCSAAVEYFNRLIDYAAPKGVRISAYNCGWNNFVDNAESWTAVLGQLPRLGIKYDPSHSRYAGRDYLKEMRDFGSRFHHVHIKGSLLIDGKRFDDPPAGLDQTDWGSFMAVLYASGYDGGLSIEPHSSTWKGELGDRGIQYTIRHMRNLML
jgi:sugar phosphate isomerase/epimerase